MDEASRDFDCVLVFEETDLDGLLSVSVSLAEVMVAVLVMRGAGRRMGDLPLIRLSLDNEVEEKVGSMLQESNQRRNGPHHMLNHWRHRCCSCGFLRASFLRFCAFQSQMVQAPRLSGLWLTLTIVLTSLRGVRNLANSPTRETQSQSTRRRPPLL